jgi:Fe-S-cluster containining protein
MKEYLNKEICAACGGYCCKKMPAPYVPKDILRIFGSVEAAVASGKVGIDSFPLDTPGYYMRPKTIGVESLADFSLSGVCVFLSEKGCSLPREQMPTLCKNVEPKPGLRCDDHLRRGNYNYLAALLWRHSKMDKQLEAFLKE